MANKVDFSDPRINELVSSIQHGNQSAFKELKDILTPLIYSIISECSITPDEDVLQEADIALFNAAMRFDVSKGAKFSTYARKCIKGAVLNYINGNNEVSMSKRDKQFIAKLNQISKELEVKYARTPTPEEILNEMNDDSIDIEDIEEALTTNTRTISLDQTNDDNDRSLSEKIGVIDEQSYEEELKEKYEMIDEYLDKSNLTDVEKVIIMHLYGLRGHEKMTLTSIAIDVFAGVPRQKVETAKKKAMAKIKKQMKKDERNVS